MKRSKFLNLGAPDFIKGLVVAFLTALFTGLLQLFQTGPFLFDWATFQPIVYAAVAAGLGYIVKNLFTNSSGEILKTEK
jgi:CelD/BcsL family acetyltransferase involved in cellulose biosynthesis